MKIMIVEDEPTIREGIGEALRKWGYATVYVERFDQVLQEFLACDPHLVLMDINLPSFDGFYWCSQIRQLSKVPILFLSSRAAPMDMVMAMGMGGDDFIQKPFYTDVLMAKINALLRRTYTYIDTAPNAIEHDGVVLNVKDATLLSGGKSAELTKTEFILAYMLMEHKGTIVTRKKLMRALWQDEHFVDDNTLTVNMTRLRKKLADLGKEHFIATRKGEGYIIP
jgi:DNA-binding response OmpR family regulator